MEEMRILFRRESFGSKRRLHVHEHTVEHCLHERPQYSLALVDMTRYLHSF